jgi:hypothetical protein
MNNTLPALLTSVAALMVTTASVADVPFTPLADFGLGGQPSDVNSSGIIVGAVRVENESAPSVPVIWQTSNSAPTPLPTVNGGYAVAINSNGDIVGTEFQVSGSYGIPVLWSNGERIELPDLGEGGYANDINEVGVIIGNVISKGQYRAARWVNRELELLPLPEFETEDGVIWSFANTINSAGVISGTIQAPIATPSAALRWDSEGVAFVQSEGLETKGISVDNLGGILINGYFDGGYSRAPAVVQNNGTVNVLEIPAGLFGGASGLAMGRNGIVAGYYYASGDSGFQIKAVAWPNGVFTPLEMPAGQRYAFPSAVGMNGMVFGSATDGQTGRSVPGFWQLDIEGTTLRSTPVSGARGQTVQLAAESVRSSGANVGYSVAARVNGAIVGQSVTNSQGKASVSFTIPQSASGNQLTVQFKDETGATTTTVIEIESACAAADFNCDGRVDSADLSILLSQWGGSGACDLNADGVVNAPDLSQLIANWTL